MDRFYSDTVYGFPNGTRVKVNGCDMGTVVGFHHNKGWRVVLDSGPFVLCHRSSLSRVGA
jgi:hypothetical protein